MAKLPKFTLDYDERRDQWALEKDSSNAVIKTFATKEAATKGGALKRALGADGGSVKIQKKNGRFQEERTYPRSRDPKTSRG
jgi:Uncharacterized protein conserved in bacteria (DUF2188)